MVSEAGAAAEEEAVVEGEGEDFGMKDRQILL